MKGFKINLLRRLHKHYIQSLSVDLEQYRGTMEKMLSEEFDRQLRHQLMTFPNHPKHWWRFNFKISRYVNGFLTFIGEDDKEVCCDILKYRLLPIWFPIRDMVETNEENAIYMIEARCEYNCIHIQLDLNVPLLLSYHRPSSFFARHIKKLIFFAKGVY